MIRELSELVGRPHGKPTRVLTSNYSAKFDDLVRLDTRDGAIVVSLPKGSPEDVGRIICVANVSSGTNAITVQSLTGLIRGSATEVVGVSHSLREFLYAGNVNGTDVWLLSASIG